MKKALLILLALALVTSVFVSCDNGPKTVTITFKPGDAEGNAYTQTVVAGAVSRLRANEFENDGYGFVGWSLSPTGGHDYDDESFVSPTSDLTLYAMWSELYTITVEPADNGKIVSAVDSYIADETTRIIKLDIKPDEGYYLSTVKLTDSDNVEAFYMFQTIVIPMDSTGDIVLTPVFSKRLQDVPYVDATWDGSKVVLENRTIDNYGYSLVTKYQTSWTDGHWYVAEGDVAVDGRITVTGNVSLVVSDFATLKVEKGITVAEGAKLTIYGQALNVGKLIINSVDSGNAGIGGTDQAGCGTIEIKGGVIRVNGGENGAGIGAGNNHAAGTVTIFGGSVIAEGGAEGAGIGGGNVPNGNPGNLDGGTIIIYGGYVKAEGGKEGAGIGGGRNGHGGVFNLCGGKITAIGYRKNGAGGAGIGGGYRGNGGKVTIIGGTVEAYGGDYAAGIGGGNYASGGNSDNGGFVKISGGNVKAEGNRGAAGIGGGFEHGDGADVTITGGIINIKGGEGDIDLYTPHHHWAIGMGYHYHSEGGDDKALVVENQTLEVQNPDETEWHDWDGESRNFRMRTKQVQ